MALQSIDDTHGPSRHVMPVPELARYPLRSVEKLRFADTDGRGHVSNAVIAVCCQNARMELLADPTRAPLPSGSHFVIVRLAVDYLRPVHWPASVEIGTRIEKIGRNSVVLGQALFVRHAQVARAQATMVLVETTARRPTPLPPPLVEALAALSPPQRHTLLRTPWRWPSAWSSGDRGRLQR